MPNEKLDHPYITDGNVWYSHSRKENDTTTQQFYSCAFIPEK